MAKSFLGKVEVWGMANIPPEDTGLTGMSIYVSQGEVAGKKMRHGPRLKISLQATKGFVASVSIADKPEVVARELSVANLRKVKKFIILNKDILLKHWNMQMSAKELLNALRPIS